MNIIIAPDSFKGTMSARRVCDIVAEAIHKQLPDAQVQKLPVADGGEGMVDAYLAAAGGRKVFVEAAGPNFDRVRAFYGILPDGKTAVVELAAASGLGLAKKPKDPMNATTLGTGELILHAARGGCTRVILGLGGSATMDGGAGIARALGVKLTDTQGAEVAPTAAGIGQVEHIDTSGIPEEVCKLEFLIARDVDNVLRGPEGAAYVFGPQKGATAEQVSRIDRDLTHFAEVIRQNTGKDLAGVPGMGAAGGSALPLVAYCGAAMKPGIDLVLDEAGFDNKLKEAGLVITGEGMLDSQSLAGKVPVGVARRAKRAGVPVVVIAGALGEGFEHIYQEGVVAAFQASRRGAGHMPTAAEAERDLAALAEGLFAVGMVFFNEQ